MDNKMLNINEVAKLCGITVRSLHYYEEIGLLEPAAYASNGYRKYNNESLSKLQQILFFKELDLPLKQIKKIMDSPAYDKKAALKKHKELLYLKRDRINNIIGLIDENIGKNNLSLKEFDMTEIKKHTQEYAEEARLRWRNTDAYKQSKQKTMHYTEKDWEAVKTQSANIFNAFASCMNREDEDIDTDDLVKEWQDYITNNFYDCTDEILSGLADIYVTDERFKKNIDKYGTGLAEFISKCIKSYLSRK